MVDAGACTSAVVGEWSVIGSSRMASAEVNSSTRRVASSNGMTFAGVGLRDVPIVILAPLCGFSIVTFFLGAGC